YMPLPWAHLYEHPVSVAAVAFERDYGNDHGVFFAQLRNPARYGLWELDAQLRRFKHDPVDEIKPFRRTLRISRLPRPLRRLVWWIGLNLSGRKRAHYFGTFAVAVSSNLGTTTQYQLAPYTSTLNYGVIAADGSVDVRLTYDHRVMDGGDVARALE